MRPGMASEWMLGAAGGYGKSGLVMVGWLVFGVILLMPLRGQCGRAGHEVLMDCGGREMWGTLQEASVDRFY